LFYDDISEVLLSSVAKLCENPDFAAQMAMLLMDSAPARKSERVLRLLGENKILAMGVPAHITNILQPLKSYSLVQ
jgi:hypothetical protein